MSSPNPFVDREAFYPRKLVARNVWVGSAADAVDGKFLKDADISLVVNCTKNLRFLPGTRTQNHRVGVDDDTNEVHAMVLKIPEAVAAIDAHLRNNRGVLIHCWAGMQRSCAVAAAYLMYKIGLTPPKAMAAIKHVKQEAFEPRPTFRASLDAYYAKIIKKI
jgi:dual specificity phosphatase 12